MPTYQSNATVDCAPWDRGDQIAVVPLFPALQAPKSSALLYWPQSMPARAESGSRRAPGQISRAVRAAVSTVEKRPIGDATEGCFFLFAACLSGVGSSHRQPHTLRRTQHGGRTMAAGGRGRCRCGPALSRAPQNGDPGPAHVDACCMYVCSIREHGSGIHSYTATHLTSCPCVYAHATWADAGGGEGRGKGKGGWQMAADGCPAPDAASAQIYSSHLHGAVE